MAKKRKHIDTGEQFLFSATDFSDVKPVEASPAEVPTAPVEPAEEPPVDLRMLRQRMSDALYALDEMDDAQIRLIAMEAAIVFQSDTGHHSVYRLKSLPDRELDWYELTALLYCSFGMVFPSMIDKLDPKYLDTYKQVVNA